MSAEVREFVVRRPRHEATTLDTCRIWLELDSRESPMKCDATLVDVSRHGLQVMVASPVDPDEHVIVHIRDAQAHLDLALAARVRWQRLCQADVWAIGCIFDQALGYEIMGELFLSGILNMQPGQA